MKAIALQQAEVALGQAKSAVHAMDTATKLTEIELAWSDLLTAAQRVYSKLEQGAKGEPESYRWWSEMRHARRTKPILRYTHHARNADLHGLEPITDREPASVALGVGPGAWRFDGTLGPGGTLQVTALGGQDPQKSKFVELKAASVRLVPVWDRGDKYDPPTSSDGQPISPSSAAHEVLTRLTAIVEDASKLPVH
ncbi:hypothetical protein HZZ13_08780 [Bradyrhizobium sp. CNPSo 4010]|uniref:Uncharacterized protein n=1 Tax=Bradyrhizobium agreste TaxID=2751811 RepID=A0ABS0PL97_9BRAD|nr:hypothetical protein [Bradyrhizobium agreste]MBH5397885.1 hypothetical protein [Bradyrhizobium agreste]